MTYVIAQPCVDVLDKACIEECPVDCIYEGERMLYIHPDECVDCGACEPVCPVEAIFYEDDVPGAVEGLLQGQRRVLRRPRLARRRLQGRQDRQGPPDRRGAAAAGAPSTDRPRRARPPRAAGCRTSPGTGSRRYADDGRGAHPDGIVDLSVGTPVDPTPERRPRRRWRAAADAPGYPLTAGHAARCGPRPPAGWPAALGVAGRRRRRCCRRSAPRSWSRWLPTLLGLGAGRHGASSPRWPTRPTTSARGWPAPTVRRPPTSLTRRARPGRAWCGSTRRPTRPGGCCPPSTCARWSRGPASAARSWSSRRVLPRAAAGTPSRSRCCIPTSAAASHDGLLAVHSLSKRSNLAGYRAGFVAGDPALVARAAARCASTPA